jgi:hypothetical protein
MFSPLKQATRTCLYTLNFVSCPLLRNKSPPPKKKKILTRDLSNMMYSNTFSYIAHVHESGQKINTRQVFINDGLGSL